MSTQRREVDGPKRKRRIVPPPVTKEQPNIYKYGLRTPRRTNEGDAEAPSAAEELSANSLNGTNTNVRAVNGVHVHAAPVNDAPVNDAPVNDVRAPRAARVSWSGVLAPLWYPAWLAWLACYALFSVLTYWDTLLLHHLHQFWRYTRGDRVREYHPTALGRTLLLALLSAALLWALLSRPSAGTSSATHDLHSFEALSEALSEEIEHVKSSTRALSTRLEGVPSAARVQLLEEHVRGLDQSLQQLQKHVTGLKAKPHSGEVSATSDELLRDMAVSISTLQTSLANTAHSHEDKVTILTERLAGLSLSFDGLTDRMAQQAEQTRAQLLKDAQLQALIDARVQQRLDTDPRLNRPEPQSVTLAQVQALVERELTAFMNERVPALVDNSVRELRSDVRTEQARAESELSAALLERLTRVIEQRTASHVTQVSGSDAELIERLIARAMHKYYDNDVAQLTDYALLTADAHVYRPLTHYAPLALPETRSWSWLTALFGTTTRVRTPHGPRVAIHRSGPRTVGECWGFGGASANLTVKLSQPIHVSHVTIDHLSRDIAYNIESAPRHFQIWSVNVTHADPEHSPRTLLGAFEYDLDGEPVQTFALPNKAIPSQYVTLQVLSNHGHQYTCLYRFRVHGTPLKGAQFVN